jgi:Mn-dependent DtxR family transcriptional regulator
MNIFESESMENYLETIYILSKWTGQVRSADIVNELNFSRPSVSVAMKKLRESNHVNVDSEGYITLTEAGLVTCPRLLYQAQC